MAKVADVRKSEQIIKMFLGGKERRIHFDLNSFAELEKRFGDMNAVMSKFGEGGVKNIKIFLWAALIHEEVKEFDEDGEPLAYNITPYEVGSMVSPANMQEVSANLARAMGMVLPDDPKKAQKKLEKEAKKAGVSLPAGVQLANVEPSPESSEDDSKNA